VDGLRVRRADPHLAAGCDCLAHARYELPLLHGHDVGYIVADQRKLVSDNVRGYYFSVPASEHDSLLPPEAVRKFAQVPLGRVYDSGDIVVYDLGDRP